MRYQQKNTSFLVNGNVAADNLLYMLDNNVVLSEALKSNISSLVLRMITNFDANKPHVISSIENLKSNMQCMSIFSDKFIASIRYSLMEVYAFENSKK